MTRIYIHLPDGAASEPLALPAGEVLLIGRDPDPEAMDGTLGERIPTRRHKLASSLVSSNHLLLCPIVDEGGSAFDRAVKQALRWWIESEGGAPERFDELGRFCESYLKSSFVAHSLGLADVRERPESFDRERRQRLGCDLTTLKRKMDDSLALRQGLLQPSPPAPRK